MNEKDPDGSNTGKATDPNDPVRFRPLRIWPAAVLGVLLLATRFVPQMIKDGGDTLMMVSSLGPILCSLFLLIYWLLASRANWLERVIGTLGIGLALGLTILVAHPSMRGIVGLLLITVPMGMACFALGLLLVFRIRNFKRTAFTVLLAAGGFAFSTLLRSEGITSNSSLELYWRWGQSAEEKMLVEKESGPAATTNSVSEAAWEQALAQPDWPGFRGPDRTGSQRGPAIATDFQAHPPKRLWSIPVGPAWSSFAVAGKFLFTQEQRGPMETVVCYHAESGQEAWTHPIPSRFEEPLGGPGPRATPQLSGDGLFVTGAEGWLLRLDAKTGQPQWKVDLRQVAERKTPTWGFASSPHVVGSVVIVFAGGAGDKGTLGFDKATGELRWSAAAGRHSYSSPQPALMDGRELVMILTNAGLDLLDPVDGKVWMSYPWKQKDYRVLQPRWVGPDSVLLASGMKGTRRIRIKKEGDTMSGEEVWTSRFLKTDFNDFVVYQGHAYGFDGGIFASIDLETGKRNWKGGRYGKGQILLLEESGHILVSSERGEVVLLRATPEAHTELTRFKALDGKTWNHPVLAGDRLYLRNAREAACYQLALAERQSDESQVE